MWPHPPPRWGTLCRQDGNALPYAHKAEAGLRPGPCPCRSVAAVSASGSSGYSARNAVLAGEASPCQHAKRDLCCHWMNHPSASRCSSSGRSKTQIVAPTGCIRPPSEESSSSSLGKPSLTKNSARAAALINKERLMAVRSSNWGLGSCRTLTELSLLRRKTVSGSRHPLGTRPSCHDDSGVEHHCSLPVHRIRMDTFHHPALPG